jgi:hypothetical protein
MKRLFAAVSVALACAGLAVAAASAASPEIGFAEDATKYADDGGDQLFTEMNVLGTTTNRVAVFWDANDPSTIHDQGFLDRMVPVAQQHNVHVVFAIYPLKAVMAPTTPAAVDSFCNYAVTVMQRYSYWVTKVIIGNEPNQPRFWQPVWNGSQPASPAAMEAVLASCYDKIKAYNSNIDVIGVGLSPRGNDKAPPADNASISPMRWIKALGVAYRASGRTKPLFDEWSWHCYPNVNTDELEVGYPWPNTGCVNAARVKLALWDAFHGTAQPVLPGYPVDTTGTTLFGNTIRMFIDETGWQVDTTTRPGYVNAENVPTIDEAKQARIYEKLVHLANCEPTLTAFHIFHEIDEADRTGFQSGVLRVAAGAGVSTPGSRLSLQERPSATDGNTSVQHGIATDQGRCTSPVFAKYGSFLYSTSAVAPLYDAVTDGKMPYVAPHPFAALTASGGAKYLALTAGEGFTYTVAFSTRQGKRTVAGAAPRQTATLKVPTGALSAVVKLAAEMNPGRTSTVTVPLALSR